MDLSVPETLWRYRHTGSKVDRISIDLYLEKLIGFESFYYLKQRVSYARS